MFTSSQRSVSDPNHPYTRDSVKSTAALSAASLSTPVKPSAPIPRMRSLRSRFQAFSIGGKKNRSSGTKGASGDESAVAHLAGILTLPEPAGPPPPRPANHPDSPAAEDHFEVGPSVGEFGEIASSVGSARRRPSLIPAPIASTSNSLNFRVRSPRLDIIADRMEAGASAATKAGYRISSDFERPQNQPSLAELRAQQMKKSHSKSFSAGGAYDRRDSVASSIKSPLSLSARPSRNSSPRPSSRAQNTTSEPHPFAPAGIASQAADPSKADRTPTGVEKSQRPFSPSPTALPPPIGTIQSSSPIPSDPSLKDDLAFRRLLIVSHPSPLPNSADEKVPSSPSMGVTGSEAGEDHGAQLESGAVVAGLGIEASPGGNTDVSSVLNGYGWSTGGSPLDSSSPPNPHPFSEDLSPYDPELEVLQDAREAQAEAAAAAAAAAATDVVTDSEDPSSIVGLTPLTPDRSSFRARPKSGTFVSVRSPLTGNRTSTHRSSGDLEGDESTRGRFTHRNSAGDSAASSASASRAVPRSLSRQSGNTFGGSSPEPDQEPFDESSRPGSFQPDQLDVSLTARSSDLRRSRSAIENVRAVGGQEISSTGTVENNPVFVPSRADFLGPLYRSSSARLASSVPSSTRGSPRVSRGELGNELKESRKSWRNHRARSEGYSDATAPWPQRITTSSGADSDVGGINAGEEDPASLADDENETGLGLSQKLLASPLDDLIADLGGRRRSSSSLGSSSTHHLSLSGHTSDPPRNEAPSPSSKALPALPSFALLTPERNAAPSPSSLPPIPALELSPTEQLSVDEMEREIARMEAELSLNNASKRSSFHPSPAQSLVAYDQQGLAFPSPPSRVPLSRSISQSSATSAASDITPRSARRWSIVEVELAYQRMKAMLGSTRSLAASDTATLTGDSENGDVESAFERALRGSISREQEGDVSNEDDLETMLLVPSNLSPRKTPPSPAISRFLPNPDSFIPEEERTPKLNQPSKLEAYEDQTETLESYKSERSPGSSDTRKSWSDTRSGPVGSSPATSTLFSAPSHKASRESMAEASFKSNRRHTFTAPVRREELDDVFRAEEEERVHRRQESETTEREMQRRSPGGLRNGNGLQPAHVPSPRPRTAPSTFDDEERPTSSQRPRTAPSTFEDEDRSVRSPRPPRPNSRMSATIAGLRSGAGRDWVKENQRLWLGTDGEGPPSPSDSVAVQASHTANGSHTASPFVARSPTKPSVSRRWTQESTLGDDRSSELEIDVRRAVPKVANESDAWYPSTPDRATHRQNAKAAKQALAESLNGGGNGGDEDAEMSMARIRGMDKLEIFFKYAAVKTELERTELERDALIDALHESRATLSDVRLQRDALEAELRGERSAMRQLTKFLGSDPESHADRLEELVRARQIWEKRAREALEDMERAKEDAEELRSVVVEGREREERLERELALLGAKLAVAKADNADRSSSRPIREGMHRFPRARNSDGEASVRSVRYNSGSSVVRPTSFVNSIDRELSSSAFPQTPASKVAAAYRERTPSTTSSILAAAYRERIPSMASSTGLGGLGDLTSPLMGQTMAFGPKSSYGSNPSPLKSHGVQQQQPSGLRSPIQKPLLLSSSIARLSRRESKDSLASSDWGEHLPPPSDRPWNANGSGSTMPELNERDEAFLSDLSGPIQI